MQQCFPKDFHERFPLKVLISQRRCLEDDYSLVAARHLAVTLINEDSRMAISLIINKSC